MSDSSTGAPIALVLMDESPKTIMQTYVNLFRSGMAKEVGRITSMKKFYDVLASKFNLELGNVLLATSKKSDLQTMINNDWPFFTKGADLVKPCLSNSGCNETREMIQNLGAVSIAKYKGLF